MRLLTKALILFSASYFIEPSYAEDFDLQKFINSDEMLDFSNHYENIRLFVAEKSSATPFTDFNINEADLFFLGTYNPTAAVNNQSIYFDRHYQIIQHSTKQYINFEILPHELGIYPLADAVNKTIQTCELEKEKLTSIAVNHPSTAHDVIIYLFTTQDNDGYCTQSLFDTFHKNVICKVSPANCYTLNDKETEHTRAI